MGGDTSPIVAAFAAKYPLATFEFNGSIGAMGLHEGMQTRFDILISPGDKGTTATRGPNFQFRDVAAIGLLTGANIPESIGPDTNLRVVAQVQEYDQRSCLFVIKPVTVEAR